MENQIENILVFATNIRTENDKQTIGNVLDEHSEIQKWNIDQEDIDCVLRIESETLSEEDIIGIIKNQDFNCFQLE
jgi:hypothetical protein